MVHDYADEDAGYTDDQLGELVCDYQRSFPVLGKEYTNVGSVLNRFGIGRASIV